MRIFKIFRDTEWRQLEADGTSPGAPVDVADGFVHFSTAAQAGETLARHFAGETGLWLLTCDAARLGPSLRWEPSRGGALFPHLHRPLHLADIVSAAPLERDAAGGLRLPEEDRA